MNGARVTKSFSRKNTHLILNEGDMRSAKVNKAKEWNILAVGVQWLYACAAETVYSKIVPELSNSERGETLRDAKKSLVASGSNPFARKRVEITKIAMSLGAQILDSYSDECTHYVFESSRVNESFEEFKDARRSGKYIVSPAWIYNCYEAIRRLNEADFSHNYVPRKTLSVEAKPPKTARKSIKSSKDSSSSTKKRNSADLFNLGLKEKVTAFRDNSKSSVVSDKAIEVDKYVAAVDQLLNAAGKTQRSNSLIPFEPTLERSVFDEEFLNDKTLVDINSEETVLREEIVYDDPAGRSQKRRLIAKLTNKGKVEGGGTEVYLSQ
ncbi:DNA topoisomerase 2-binding protein 1 [Irineochytrium annulatum]|nr:DNA topoisomerase 2-binding protein 1 [Irineochytrium annulatum]